MLRKVFNSCIKSNTRTYSLEKMPHPISLPLVGTKLNFILFGSGTKLHEYVDHRHKQLGPIFHENLGGKTELVFISDPNLMKSLFLNLEGKHPAHILPEPWVLYEKLYGFKRGLFFMNGEEWLTNRRIMNKHLLHFDSEKWLEEPIKDTIKQFVSEWKNRAKEETFIPDLETDLYRLSVNVIVNILLGSESTFIKSKQYEDLMQMFSESVKRIFQTTTKLYGLPLNLCHKLGLSAWREFKESVDISLLLAQKLVNEILQQRNKTNGLIRMLSNDNINDEAITRIIADFVIAAGDTTAYTSQWILYLLSKNPEIKAEITMRDGSYVKQVVKEAMRLYPVAPFLTRILLKDSQLGQFKLNAYTPIIASIYTSGRDENYFSNADKFLPCRWDRNSSQRQSIQNHTPSASLPFALGARSCIGKKIAMVQLIETTSQIARNFDFKCINNTEVRAVTSQVLVPNQSIKLMVSNK